MDRLCLLLKVASSETILHVLLHEVDDQLAIHKVLCVLVSIDLHQIGFDGLQVDLLVIGHHDLWRVCVALHVHEEVFGPRIQRIVQSLMLGALTSGSLVLLRMLNLTILVKHLLELVTKTLFVGLAGLVLLNGAAGLLAHSLGWELKLESGSLT